LNTPQALLSIQNKTEYMPEQTREDTVGKTVSTTLEFGPPKFQATIPEHVRRILNVTEHDLKYEKGEEMEKVVVSAELTVEEIYTKDLGGES
jgi:hypothetical protein